MAKEFFPEIGKIKFEGKESKNPLAYHYYDADKVIMGKYTGTTVKLDGEEYTIVRQDDILAVVTD